MPPAAEKDGIAVRVTHNERHLADHEQRIRKLERFNWKLAAAVLVAAASGGGLPKLAELLF